MGNMVQVKSTVNNRVVLKSDTLNFRRVFPKKNTILPIDMDILTQIIYEPGTLYMFEQGILYIEDMNTKIALGLEQEGAKEPTNIRVLNDNQIIMLIKVKPLKDFTDTLSSISREQVIEIANKAIEIGDISFDKAAVLKKMTGLDVIRAIQVKKEDAEGSKGDN